LSKTRKANTTININNNENAEQKIHNRVFFSPPDDHLHSQSPSNIRRTLNSQIKSRLTEKFDLLEEKRIEFPEKRIPAPQTAPVYKKSMIAMVRHISIGQLRLAVWLCFLPAPANLLIS